MSYHGRDVHYELVFRIEGGAPPYRHSLVFQDICFYNLLDLTENQCDILNRFDIESIIYHIRWHDSINSSAAISTWIRGIRKIYPDVIVRSNHPAQIYIGQKHPAYILFVLRTLRMVEEQAEAIDTFAHLINQGCDPYFSLLMCQQYIIKGDKVTYHPIFSWESHWLFNYPIVTPKVYRTFKNIRDRTLVPPTQDYNNILQTRGDVKFALGTDICVDEPSAESLDGLLDTTCQDEQRLSVSVELFNKKIRELYERFLQHEGKENAA